LIITGVLEARLINFWFVLAFCWLDFLGVVVIDLVDESAISFCPCVFLVEDFDHNENFVIFTLALFKLFCPCEKLGSLSDFGDDDITNIGFGFPNADAKGFAFTCTDIGFNMVGDVLKEEEFSGRGGDTTLSADKKNELDDDGLIGFDNVLKSGILFEVAIWEMGKLVDDILLW